MMQELYPSQSHTIIVDARSKWNASKIYLKSDFTYSFEVIQINEEWKDGTLDADPEVGTLSPPFYLKYFNFLKRFTQVNWYVLVGSIGRNKKTFFKIGRHLSYYIPPSNGELYCFANDAVGFYFNNKGKLTLKISCLDKEKLSQGLS